MKKAIKIVGYVVLGLIVLSLLAIGGLYALQKYRSRGSVDFSEWQTYYMDEIPVEQKDFKEDFESIFDRVNDRYAYIQRKHLDMDSLHKLFLGRLDTVSSKTAYSMLLREFFGCLRGGHADIAFKSRGLGFDIAVVEQRVFIDYPRIQLMKAGMQQGDEIVAVDGVPVQQWISSNEKYISASTNEYRYLRSALEVMCSYTDSVRTYSILRNGQLIDMTLKLHSVENLDGPTRYKTVDWRKLNEDFGYLSVSEMNDEVPGGLVEAMRQLRQLPNLIVDVRRNGGGNSQIGDSLATYLIKGERTAWNGTSLQPRKDAYKGKVYILMGTYSFSSAESFLITMRESGDAALVGDASAGDTGGFPLCFKSEHGMYFRLPISSQKVTPRGHPLEGVAIQPDYFVSQSVADFLMGRDTQLEYVLRLKRK